MSHETEEHEQQGYFRGRPLHPPQRGGRGGGQLRLQRLYQDDGAYRQPQSGREGPGAGRYSARPEPAAGRGEEAPFPAEQG